MSQSKLVPLLAAFAMMSPGVVSMTGCAAKVTVAPPQTPVAVVEAPAPPPAAVVVAPPPPAPKLTTVCDAEIRPEGHLHFPHEVEFDEGKATLKSTPTTNAILQCLVDFFNNNAMVTKFRIEGYTDNKGDAALNQTLSEQRAQAIVSWLTAHNVSAAKLWGKGYGPAKPVAANDSDANRAKNRRVEFHIDELNSVHVNRERIALAMNPPTVAVTSVSVAAPATGVAVVGTAPAAGVVTVTTPGVAVTTPGVSASVSLGVGGGGAAPGKPAAPAKKDDKKDDKAK